MQKIKLFILLPLVLMATIAQAQDGLYAAIDTGSAILSGLPSATAAQASSVDRQFIFNAVRGSLGYNHDLNNLFGVGVEVGVGQYGHTVYNYTNNGSTKISAETVEFLAETMWHICPKIDLIAKAGGIRLSPKVTGTNSITTNTEINMQASVGSAYNFTQHLAATLSYAHVFGDSSTQISNLANKTPKIDEVLLGLRYNFGS